MGEARRPPNASAANPASALRAGDPQERTQRILAPVHHHAPVHYAHHPECHTAKCATHADRQWARRHRPKVPTAEALASWYEDSGSTACGTHYAVGIAHLTLACGTEVRLCHAGRCETATVEDRGPYIAGRTFDLNPGAKAGIGCSDLCAVRYSVK